MNTFDVISRGDVAERRRCSVRREQKLRAINLLEDVMDIELGADFPCLRSIFRSLVRYDLGLLVRGTAAGSKRPSRVKNGQVERRISECRIDAG